VIERLSQLGRNAFGPTVAGHGKGVTKNVTPAESTQSIIDFILGADLTEVVLVGHSYGASSLTTTTPPNNNKQQYYL
jgi:pimeloyl-ACP methyl ester carboxylesterase